MQIRPPVLTVFLKCHLRRLCTRFMVRPTHRFSEDFTMHGPVTHKIDTVRAPGLQAAQKQTFTFCLGWLFQRSTLCPLFDSLSCTAIQTPLDVKTYACAHTPVSPTVLGLRRRQENTVCWPCGVSGTWMPSSSNECTKLAACRSRHRYQFVYLSGEYNYLVTW